jgi:DNA-binding HxlR family transcriptional regulator
MFMKRTHHRRSDCPINFVLEIFGDTWSLLMFSTLTCTATPLQNESEKPLPLRLV